MKEIYSIQLEDEEADALIEIIELTNGTVKPVPFSGDFKNYIDDVTFLEELVFWHEGSHVVGIVFAYTEIEKIPSCIGNFVQLKFLVLYSSHIQYLPPELKKLHHIEYFSLYNEELDQIVNIEFPDIFQFLNNLKKFIIRGRIEIYIPPSFTTLTNLEELELEFCTFFTNHSIFSRCTKERMRDVRVIEESEECINRFTSIYEKYIDNVNELPQDFDKLKSLNSLVLEDIYSEIELPASIVNIPNLKKLYIRRSDVKNIKIVFEIKSLEELVIAKKYLRIIPDEILKKKKGLEIISY